MSMQKLVITPAKRRFGRKPRKQWQFTITAANGEAIDPRDTYANPADIRAAILAVRSKPMKVEIHYGDDVRTELWQ